MAAIEPAQARNDPARLAEALRVCVEEELSRLGSYNEWEIGRLERRIAQCADEAPCEPNVYALELHRRPRGARPPFAALIFDSGIVIVRREFQARVFPPAPGMLLMLRTHIRSELPDITRKTNR